MVGNADFIDVSEFTSHPIFLNAKVNMVDKYLRQLLNKNEELENATGSK